MKQLINRIDQAFFRFKKLLKMIDHEAEMKNVVKSVLSAFILSLSVIAIPVLIIINMFIISKLTLILAILLVILVVLWPFIYYAFYYRMLKNYHPKIQSINTKLPYLVESSLIAFILLIIGIVVLSIIF